VIAVAIAVALIFFFVVLGAAATAGQLWRLSIREALGRT
jgi:hypothetical protein